MNSDNIWLVPTEVRSSLIHGNGRFASVPVGQNTVVGILNGLIIPVDGTHLPIKDTGYCIDCPNTMINHSRHANLTVDGQIVLRATRDIAAGDELTLDYRTLTSSLAKFY
jgi:SET domain